MNIQYGAGETNYGPGVRINLTGDESVLSNAP